MDTDLAKTRVDSMLSSGHADPATFAATVLAKITIEQVDAVLAQLGAALGTYDRLEGTRGTYVAHFAKGTNDVLVSLDMDGINLGSADPAAFRSVAFKGGSDVGAINLTTQVTTKRGTVICFSATLNDATRALDDYAFTLAYGVVLGTLANR